MTANPDSALRQALVAAEKATAELAAEFQIPSRFPMASHPEWDSIVTEFYRRQMRAREAHALITEALQRGEK